MENRPPQQETPRRPPAPGRKPNGSGGSQTPPWLWLLVLGLLALIFWQFVPKNEVQVLYQPWFMEQVENDNIKSISFQSNEFRGELRRPQPYRTATGASTLVKRFYTYAPSEDLIQPVVERLQEHARDARKTNVDPVRIEGSPPSTANGLAWVMILMPTFLIAAFIWLMMRRARGG